jgi:hypothetical protein
MTAIAQWFYQHFQKCQDAGGPTSNAVINCAEATLQMGVVV